MSAVSRAMNIPIKDKKSAEITMISADFLPFFFLYRAVLSKQSQDKIPRITTLYQK
jgi:hypothetical protein